MTILLSGSAPVNNLFDPCNSRFQSPHAQIIVRANIQVKSVDAFAYPSSLSAERHLLSAYTAFILLKVPSRGLEYAGIVRL